MKREEKAIIIDSIKELVNKYNHFYLTDISDLDAKKTSDLRRQCFEKEIELVVVKNTLLQKALEAGNKKSDELFVSLKGATSVMFSNVGNDPAKLIKSFRKSGSSKPILKAAFVEESIYLGDDQLEKLVNIKSKEELIGDVIMLLQSPMKNVVSSLQSGKHILAGIVKTLSEKE
ncbi:MAG TPA: 50S ribosomal protein L10 [Bacteroidales bacterium]|nr:MAG: 50S ribosomal protein L10 [Bacteroidetes bacterium GWF2_33_38]OFY74366.1 MAG: 50S ribosomal protein L10 [Bacteroidetes bacterium RIFOXYA12_FULL_33_9]HBF88434.1 50S ribosomal protein L10 [Bacteroidales bacterium]